MKQRRASLIIAGLFAGFTVLFGYAAELSSDDALCAVKGWVKLKEALGGDFDANPESVTAYDGEDGKGRFYVVALEGGGYVVASGDDELTPILAYSREGTFEANEKNPLWASLPAAPPSRRNGSPHPILLLPVAHDGRDAADLQLRIRRRFRRSDDEGRNIRLGEHAAEHKLNVCKRNERDCHKIPPGHRETYVRCRRFRPHELYQEWQRVVGDKASRRLQERLRLFKRHLPLLPRQ